MSIQISHRPPRIGHAVEVRQVASWWDRRRFLRLPWQIYAGDPCWVPPLLLERSQFINPRKHPFYRHGAAALFLGLRQGRPVGRIMASDDPNFNAAHRDNAGCFGLFESLDDADVAHSLLDAAAEWLAERGRTRIVGPIDYSINYPCGLLIDGFDEPPRVMMNHNPPYYRPLIESWGLSKAKDLYAWWFDRNDNRMLKWRGRVERLAARGGVTVRPFRRHEQSQEVALLQTLYNQAWKENWGMVPMTRAEFERMAADLIHLVVPEMLLIAEVAGRPVGFSITLPDFNEVLSTINGRLFHYGLPLGAWKIWRGLKQVKTARLLALGVLDEFRRRGIAELLILRTFDHGMRTLGFTGAELGWTLEDNALINRASEAVGGRRYKTYRIFDRPIGAAH